MTPQRERDFDPQKLKIELLILEHRAAFTLHIKTKNTQKYQIKTESWRFKVWNPKNILSRKAN